MKMAHKVENFPPCEVYLDGDETDDEIEQNKQLLTLSTHYAHKLLRQIIYRGMLFNEVIRPEDLQQVKQIVLRSDDILLCGFPRSGTTWLGEILYLLIGDINLDAIEKMMCYSRVLWLDDKRSHKLLPDFPQPRLMKSHLLPEMMPPSAFSCRIVLAIRNVKDVVVALYHFYKMNSHFGNFEKSFEEFACMFVDGYMHWGDWARHVYSWWQKTKDSQNILPVFYEETKANPRETVRKLAEFLNKEVSDDDVEQIVEATSFTKMKARPTTNLEHNKSISGSFIRKGQVGDWKNYFSKEQSAKFDAWIDHYFKDKELRKHIQIE